MRATTMPPGPDTRSHVNVRTKRVQTPTTPHYNREMQTEGATSSTAGLNSDELQLIKTYFETQGILSFSEFQEKEEQRRTAIECARQEQEAIRQDPNYMCQIQEILVHPSQPVQDLNSDWDEDGFPNPADPDNPVCTDLLCEDFENDLGGKRVQLFVGI